MQGAWTPDTNSDTAKGLRPAVLIVALGLALIATRWLMPERPSTYTGPRALVDTLFALGLLALILLLSGCLGGSVLRHLRLRDLTRLEQAIFAVPVGLGILAYGVLALGLVGLLRPGPILVWLAAVAVWTSVACRCPVGNLSGLSPGVEGAPRESKGFEKWLLIVGGLIAASCVLQALAPPWTYDALMYHLQGPRLFLQAGRLTPLPDVWQANGPSTIEMLFTIGLAFGSDSFAGLVHLAYGALFVLGTYALGRRLLGRRSAGVATAFILGGGGLAFWAGMPYVDIGWALYQFLAFYALLVWSKTRERCWLVMAGLLMGWALGSKYLALEGVLISGLWLLWQDRKVRLRNVLTDGALFAATALAVAAPWYIKNWLWSGNPVYPFLVGGPGWDAERLGALMLYLNSFGAGRGVGQLLLLPWNVYAKSAKFSTFVIHENPGFLLPLALLYPFLRRDRELDSIAGWAGLSLVAWALGSQQTRFMLPIYPALSVLSAFVLTGLVSRIRSVRKAREWLPRVFIAVPTLAVLYTQVLVLLSVRPLAVVIGLESKDSFLRRGLADYAALQVVVQTLSPEDRVLMMWDGQGYYCDARCIPDTDQSAWTRLASSMPDPRLLASELRAQGITHLLFSRADVEFLLDHDPDGKHRQALDYFLHSFLPTCAHEIYSDQYMLLTNIQCSVEGLPDVRPGVGRATQAAEAGAQ